MGANQSTGSDGAGSRNEATTDGNLNRCYYEVLGLEREASDDEIKKSYRRKALELHPDRNFGNVEEATKQFATIQAAYEVLSDPQERAWYDSHRETVLRGDGGADRSPDDGVKVTTAEDLIRQLARLNNQIGAHGPTNAFYSDLGTIFSALAKEEDVACRHEDVAPMDYPDFGDSGDSWEAVVKPFYAIWSGFSTRKSFAWKDVYRSPDAPDRRIRRAMEKENRRFRDEAIREFNDAVRSLVAFAKRRDPRFQVNAQTEAQRQQTLKDAARAQAERSRAANQSRLEALQDTSLPTWAHVRSTNEDGSHHWSDSEEEEIEHLECVVCKKVFKSEKQYEAHERSKKHIKAVQVLQKELRREDKTLHLEDRDLSNDEVLPFCAARQTTVAASNVSDHPGADTVIERTAPTSTPEKDDISETQVSQGPASQTSQSLSSGDDDSTCASRETVNNRAIDDSAITSATNATEGLNFGRSSSDITDSMPAAAAETLSKPKLGKAKEKRMRKAAHQANDPIAGEKSSQCGSCHQAFPSRTKLFHHIKQTGHAQPKPAAPRRGKKG